MGPCSFAKHSSRSSLNCWTSEVETCCRESCCELLPWMLPPPPSPPLPTFTRLCCNGRGFVSFFVLGALGTRVSGCWFRHDAPPTFVQLMFRVAILRARRETERMCAAPQPPERTRRWHRSAATSSATDPSRPRLRRGAAENGKQPTTDEKRRSVRDRLDAADDAMTDKFATG